MYIFHFNKIGKIIVYANDSYIIFQGTRKVRGMSLDLYKIDELQIHKEAFKEMRNLRFVKLYTRKWDHNKEVRWHLHEDFNFFPPKLRHLGFDGYPMRRMPSNFRPENLVKLRMEGSKLEKLWEGIHVSFY